MTTHRKNQVSSIGMVIAAVGAALALVLASNGCGSEATADPPMAASVTTGTAGAMVAPPTLSDLQGALGLNDEQAQVVGEALSRWQEQARTRSGARHRMRDGSQYAGPVQRPQQGMAGHRPPMMGFLADCSATLDANQFRSLCGILARRQDQQRDRMRRMRQDRLQDGTGDRQMRRDRVHRGDRLQNRDRAGRGSGPGMMADLNLTAEQRQQVRTAMRTAQTTVHDLVESHAEGNATAEAVRDGALAAQNQLRTALQSALDTQQMTDFSSALSDGASRVATRRLERLQNANGADRRVEFLTRVLQLDDSQKEAVKSVLDAARSDQRTFLEGIRDGKIQYADALYQGIQLHDRIHDGIRDRLREDQQDRLDALKQLRNGPRPFRIYL